MTDDQVLATIMLSTCLPFCCLAELRFDLFLGINLLISPLKKNWQNIFTSHQDNYGQTRAPQEQKGKEKDVIMHNTKPCMLGPMYAMLLSSIHHPSMLMLS